MELILHIGDILGWLALHALWQIALVCLVAKVLLEMIPAKALQTRMFVLLSAVGVILLSAAATLLYVFEPINEAGQAIQHLPTSYYMQLPDLSSSSEYNAWAWIETYNEYLGIAWLLGMMGMSMYWLNAYWQLKKLKGRAEILNDGWHYLVREWSVQAGKRSFPSVAISKDIASPVLCGIFQPMILIPAGILESFNEEQIKCILRHEWLHWKRYDHLLNMGLILFESIFFFHPLVWWLGSEIRHLQELAVDRATLEHTYEPLSYAKTLYAVQEYALRPTIGVTHFASRKGKLLERIENILQFKSSSKHTIMKTPYLGMLFISGMLTLLISLAAYSIKAEKPNPPEKLEVGKILLDAESPMRSEPVNTPALSKLELQKESTKPEQTLRSVKAQTLSKNEPEKTDKTSEQVQPSKEEKREGSKQQKEYLNPSNRITHPKILESMHATGILQDTTPTKEDWEAFEKQMRAYAEQMAEWGKQYAEKIQQQMPPRDSFQKMIQDLQQRMQNEQWSEEEMEAFEKKMEAYEEKMEAWGQKVEEMMEEWARKYEKELDEMGDEYDSLEKVPPPPPMPPPPPPIPESPEPAETPKKKG